ncbi:gp24 [Listeria phage P35]|uniref:Uncharacterized protein n=1 Tax=Listeria phage LP-083-1 TaxID=1458854 RepID=A0A059T6G9_9CAUD|nr:gp24 [Listeria phage P35]AAY53209.1 gp24 [Listeria phage P35]AHL18989.1 hypothetical protein LP083-1_024 [Listeria phage LP-083-1]
MNFNENQTLAVQYYIAYLRSGSITESHVCSSIHKRIEREAYQKFQSTIGELSSQESTEVFKFLTSTWELIGGFSNNGKTN